MEILTVRLQLMQQNSKKPREGWARFTISSLEADVAYFDARLALLGRKNATYHQLAQVKAYTELERVLSGMLTRLKGASERAREASGIEVAEAPGPQEDEASRRSADAAGK